MSSTATPKAIKTYGDQNQYYPHKYIKPYNKTYHHRGVFVHIVRTEDCFVKAGGLNKQTFLSSFVNNDLKNNFSIYQPYLPTLAELRVQWSEYLNYKKPNTLIGFLTIFCDVLVNFLPSILFIHIINKI